MWKTIMAMGVLCGALPFSAYPAQTNDTSANDEDFVEFAGETDLTLARLGAMAESRAADARVKQFGHAMQRDHAQDLTALTGVANRIGAVAPNSLDDVHKQVLRRFAGLNGVNFDRAFLKEMSDRHANAIRAYQREADHGFNAALKAYAKKALPHLEEHLREAQQLAEGK